MGTSSSSNGPGANVPLVPPWVPPIPPPDDAGEDAPTPIVPTSPQIPIAPSGRFQSTRLNLSRFASSGDKDNLRRGVGNYFKSGYGGGGTAARRFGGTANTAGALYGALSGAAGTRGTPERDALEAAVRSGGSTESIISALVEAIQPVDGRQDSEANRKALADALSELMTKHPDADLLKLTPEQLNLVLALFIVSDVFARFVLDVGKSIIDNAPSVATGLSRLKEVKEYIRETVIAQLNKITIGGVALSKNKVVNLVATALRDAIDVFEGYAS